MRRCNGTALETGRLEDMNLYCGCAKVEPLRWMFGAASGAGGQWVRGNMTDHRRREMRRWTAWRPLVAASLAELDQVETFFIHAGSGAPPSPLFRAGLLHGRDWQFQWAGRRSWQRIQAKTASAKMANAAAVCRVRQECGIQPNWRDGRGHLRLGVPGPAPPASPAVDRKQTLAPGQRRQQAPPPACAAGTARHRPAKPKEGEPAALAWACVGQPAPHSSYAQARRFPPGRRAAGLDGPGIGVDRALLEWQAWPPAA